VADHRWLLDEGSGNTAADSVGSLDLDLTGWLADGGSWTSETEGETLDDSGSGSARVEEATSEVQGLTQCTLEVCFQASSAAGSLYRYVAGYLTDALGSTFVWCLHSVADTVAVAGNSDSDSGVIAVDTGVTVYDGDPHVCHTVYDSPQADSDDRIAMSTDGGTLDPIAGLGSWNPAQDDGLDDAGGGENFVLFRRREAWQLGQAAVYLDQALDESTCGDLATALLSDHDADPEGAGGYTLALDGAAIPIAAQDMSPLHGRYLSLDAAAVPVAGQDLSPLRGYPLSLESSAVPVAGQDAALLHGHALGLDAGAIPVAGQDLGALHGRQLGLEAAAVPVAAQDLGVYRGYPLTLEAAAVPIAAQDLVVLVGHVLGLEGATVPVAGQDVGLLFGRLLSLEAAAVPVEGQDVTLIHTAPGSYTLALDGAAVPVAAQALGLLYGRALDLDAGAIPVAAQDLGLLFGRHLGLDGAAVPVASQDLAVLVGRALGLEAAAVPVAGQNLALIHGYPLVLDGAAVPVAGQDLGFLRGYVIALDGTAIPIVGADMGFALGGLPFVLSRLSASTRSRAPISKHRAGLVVRTRVSGLKGKDY